MKKVILFIFLFTLLNEVSFSQGSAGTKAYYETRYIVDMPTAGIIPKSSIAAYGIASPGGALQAELMVSPFTNFSIGLSYGGSNVIGSGDIKFQNIPGVLIKWRVFDETGSIPAFLIGLSTQGRGKYSFSDKRFDTYSPGIYISSSKNFKWYMGEVACHGGVCYSLEPKPKERLPNAYCGIEHSIWKYFALNLEYNMNLDEREETYMSTRGMLNAALRITIVNGFTLEVKARDILKNTMDSRGLLRSIALEYVKPF